jgi:serine/threonine protein kinase/Flp pilus assembly protein TadD
MSNSPNIDSMIGKELAGRFRLIEKIGQGGMGAVFKAIHMQMERTCAIKLLLPMSSDTESAVARFKREAQMASRIDNPHAVTIYDFGEAEGNMLYLAMEYIEGRHLGHLLSNERPFSTERIIHITNQIAAALTAAHAIGIVHRDLKPENIMLTRKGDDPDYVKVLDFGIAKPVDEDDRENLTKTGFVLGTPFYMSPEQLSGDRLDGRSDVYSLALIVYEMFSGRLPFEGDNSQAIMVKRLIAEPKPLRELLPAMSSEVEQAVMSGLERNRNQRSASIDRFAIQLKNAVLSTQSLGIRPTNPVADANSNRNTVSIAEQPTSLDKSLEDISSVIGSTGAMQQKPDESYDRTIEINQAYKPDAIVAEPSAPQAPQTIPEVEAVPIQQEPQRSPSAYITRETGDAANRPDKPQAGAELTIPFGSEKANLQFPSSPPQQPPAQNQQRPAQGQPPPQAKFSAPPQQMTEKAFVQQPPPSNYSQAAVPQHFQTPIPAYPSPLAEQPKQGSKAIVIGAVAVILLVVLVGGGYFVYTNYFQTKNSAPPTISGNTPTTSKDNPIGTDVPTTKNDVPVTKTNLEAAAIHYENGQKHQNQAYSLNNKADMVEENKKAIDEYRQAIALQPVYPQAHENLGVALYSTGNAEAAIAEYRTAIEQYTKQQQKPTSQVLTNLGLALFDTRRYQEAADAFRKAYEIDSTDTDLLAHRGFALHNAGNVEGAKELYNQYLKAAPNGDYANAIKEILAGRAKPPATTGN